MQFVKNPYFLDFQLSLPKRLRQKSKGWKLVSGKFLSETPRLLVDAANEIERLQGIVMTVQDGAKNDAQITRQLETTKRKDIFDRKEQRAIGYFIELVKKHAAKLHQESTEKGTYYCSAMEELQKEHNCYD